jgi:hypothetical protein
MTPFLKELLLIHNPNVLSLAEYLNSTALLFILPCFYLSMVCEYLTNWDFKGVVKRSMIAFLAIKLLAPLHVNFVNESLSISSQLVKKYSPHNKFLTAYNNVKMDKKAGVWKKLSSIVEMIVTDPIVLIIFLLSYIAFFLLTQLYSLVYHLGIVLIGVCALLSIFPMTARSLLGAIKTSLWCILMPFVVAIVLCLIGDSDAFLKSYTGGIVQNLESLIQLLIMTIILLMTPMITSKIMSDSGVATVAENIGQMAAMSTLIGGAGMIGAKAALAGKTAHSLTTRPLMNAGKSVLSDRASNILEKKGIAPKVSHLSESGTLRERAKAKGSEIKHAFMATSIKDKFILGADSMVNRSENKLASTARKQDAWSVKEHPQAKDDLIPLSAYKREAFDFKRKEGGLQGNLDFNKSKFLDFHRTEGAKTHSMPKAEGGFHFTEAKWKRLSPQDKATVKEKFGLSKNFVGREGFIYFPRGEGKAPMPAHIYHRTMKPKTMKELRDGKLFLQG